MRLKLASIAKIKNVDPKLQVKYLSDRSTCMDQAMYSSRKGKITIENLMEGGENELL